MGSPPTIAAAPGQVHFVLFPYMAQGHMIPMIDIAKLLASHHGIVVTIVTTPVNAARFKSPLDRAINELGLPITVVELRFPCSEVGLPENCENVDLLPSMSSFFEIFRAAALMEPQVESLFEKLNPPPSCIVSDFCLPYTNRIARKFGVPRLSFHGFGCFTLLCRQCAKEVHRLEVSSDHEYFVLPGFPGGIRFTKAQLPIRLVDGEKERDTAKEVEKGELEAYGVMVNTFEELEAEYVEGYKEVKQGKVWCIGPVSSMNQLELDKLERGNSSSSSTMMERCINWLDDKELSSVMYVCLGTISTLSSEQLIELALGLETSEKAFVWAVRESVRTKELFEWMAKEGFEERVSERGMVIRGWAPQVVILSHPAVGGFLTHCGWNSLLEGISAGVSMVTWPSLGDQFSNEKLIVEVARIGVRVGVECPVFVFGGEEVTEAMVKKEQVEKAVRLVMEGGEEGEGMRKRARELAAMAKGAVVNGGSSHRNVTMLIEDIVRQQEQKKM